MALVKLGYSEGQAAEAVARAANDLGDMPKPACCCVKRCEAWK